MDCVILWTDFYFDENSQKVLYPVENFGYHIKSVSSLYAVSHNVCKISFNPKT